MLWVAMDANQGTSNPIGIGARRNSGNGGNDSIACYYCFEHAQNDMVHLL